MTKIELVREINKIKVVLGRKPEKEEKLVKCSKVWLEGLLEILNSVKERDFLSVTLSYEEAKLIRMALDGRGDAVFDSGRKEEAQKYYDLHDKFIIKKDNIER